MKENRIERYWQTLRRCQPGSEREAYYAALIRQEMKAVKIGGLTNRSNPNDRP